MIGSLALRSSLGPLACLLVLIGCQKEEPPAAPAPVDAPQAGHPELPPELSKPPSSEESVPGVEPSAPAAPQSWSEIPAFPPNYSGAWFAVTKPAAGVYEEPSFDSTKLGYMRNGSRVPVSDETIVQKNCTQGWYALLSGGYVCGNLGTTSLSHPEVKLGSRQPDLEAVLPYPYARNSKNGTPLYRSVPSREQMEGYEPHLLEQKQKKADESSKAARGPMQADTRSGTEAVADAGAPNSDLIAAATDGGLLNVSIQQEPQPEKPWWQRENIKERLHEITLEHLEAEADEVLAKRMVAGFYVAVDRSFRWNNRPWYKTTRGYVAPSERFWKVEGSKFKGLEIDGENVRLPVGWVYGGRKSAGLYKINRESNQVETHGTLDRFASVKLSGQATEIRGTHYEELTDGTWIKRAHIRKTIPGPLPADLGPNERWLDVNLKTQTLVAFVGDKPVYATLLSSGKESKIKEKDHRTPLGEWRIREKHITTKMDGDGSAAGDLPYSIDDVPYAMYYYRAYAVHGAFWHSNYGVQMSHGCLNLSPLDAKHIFFFADPPIAAGLHGAWATDKQPGSRVVVHE